MRLLGVDFETTGLRTDLDRITEIGACLWDVEAKKPITTHGIFLYDAAYELHFTTETCEMMARVSSITPEMLREFGNKPRDALTWLDKYAQKHAVDYIVAHNGENFDRPILYSELKRNEVDGAWLRSIPWIDSSVDLPFEQEPMSRRLSHLALDAGFMNPFPHRASFDTLTMLKLVSSYPIDKILEYQRVPFIVVRAHVDFAQNEFAKQRRYSWQKIGNVSYPKMWVKRIKENRFEAEQLACRFAISRVE